MYSKAFGSSIKAILSLRRSLGIQGGDILLTLNLDKLLQFMPIEKYSHPNQAPTNSRPSARKCPLLSSRVDLLSSIIRSSQLTSTRKVLQVECRQAPMSQVREEARHAAGQPGPQDPKL